MANFLSLAVPAGQRPGETRYCGSNTWLHLTSNVAGDGLPTAAVKLYRSTDGGVSWADISANTGVYRLDSICATASGAVLAVGRKTDSSNTFSYLRSTDFGDTWVDAGFNRTSITTHGTPYPRFALGTGGAVVAIGDMGVSKIYRSADDGASWAEVHAPGASTLAISVASDGAGNFLAYIHSSAGGNATLYRSVDNGATWALAHTFTGSVFRSHILFVGTGRWLLTQNNTTLVSTDQGSTWTPVVHAYNYTWLATDLLGTVAVGALHTTADPASAPEHYAAPILVSEDYGATWAPATADFGVLSGQMGFRPEFGNGLWFAANTYADGGTVYSSESPDMWPFVAENEIEDVFNLSDEREFQYSNLIEDSVSLSDARAEQRMQFLNDAFSLNDALRQAAAMSLEDSVNVDDATHVQIQQVISDTILLSDFREQVSAGSAELQDTFSLTDALRQGGTYEVEVTVEFSDAHAQAGSLLLEDTVTVDDALNQEGVVDGGNLTDTFVLSDELQLVVASNIEIEDGITLSDDVFYKNPGAIAWVMNTETGAPSWYSNWQFVDMVQIGDRVLAVGPEGLVELGAETDAGEFIDASISYGFMDYGTDQKKRVDSFWFGYSSDDVLEVSVETLGNTVYTYSMEARNAEQARNNRIRPGKGLNARYWRVGINNVGGCDFDVDSLGADVVPTSRRL